ncbi:hypothetical protein Rhe02_37960 [Rhizocola hellebori]|uniref:Uncharacterized protein n=1 Tax=Rhizocola hellebori TaxID=1392758 RepID=A0A8J3Q805_9ACTN|nr:hypothetical protein Rhe02_37960 [Rhizocola hellebori]
MTGDTGRCDIDAISCPTRADGRIWSVGSPNNVSRVVTVGDDATRRGRQSSGLVRNAVLAGETAGGVRIGS